VSINPARCLVSQQPEAAATSPSRGLPGQAGASVPRRYRLGSASQPWLHCRQTGGRRGRLLRTTPSMFFHRHRAAARGMSGWKSTHYRINPI